MSAGATREPDAPPRSTARRPLSVDSALIVEDDAAVADAIAAHFSLQGFNVTTAQTLAEARQVLQDLRPAVISVDLNLPDGHGFDFVRVARREGVEHVIVISGERRRDNVIASLECRVLHYLVKPVRMSELMSALIGIRASLDGTSGDADPG